VIDVRGAELSLSRKVSSRQSEVREEILPQEFAVTEIKPE
jgi:hypothetical protein